MSTPAPIEPRIEAARQKIRQPRKGCQYTPEELAILNKHKSRYRRQTTHAAREQMLRTTVFVDIFNYWDDKGIPLDETEMRQRMKVCFTITVYSNY